MIVSMRSKSYVIDYRGISPAPWICYEDFVLLVKIPRWLESYATAL